MPNDKKEFSFELPEEFRTRNLLVEIQGGEQTNAKPVYANGLDVQIVNSFGQLKVANAKDGKPLPKTYVKVYSMDANGIVKFYKDGYTDLRGRFDYASQSNLSTDDLVKFSILIQNDLYGTVIRETEPPKQ